MSEDLTARLAALNDSAAFNRWAGFRVVAAKEGEVELELPWRAEFGQYAGFLYASLASGLIDTACGFAAASIVGRVLASHVAVNFMAPAVGRSFLARGQVVRAGRRQVFARAELFAMNEAGDSKPVATGETLLMRDGA